MDPLEMSQMFDVLYNNVTSNQAPNLNEYEKSVFLTKGQDQLVREYFNIRTDGAGGGYDGDQKRQYDFSSLVKVATLESIEVSNMEKLDKRSKVFLFPSDYFLAVNELISDDKYQYNVIPLNYGEYSRLMMKPYAYPVKKGAWRLFTHNDPKSANRCVKTISDNEYSILSYWSEYPITLKLNFVKNMTGPAVTGFESTFQEIEDEGTEYTIKYLYSKDTTLQCVINTLDAEDTVTGNVQNIALQFYFLNLPTGRSVSDSEVFACIQDGFKQLREYLTTTEGKEDKTILATLGLYLEDFKNIQIPRHTNAFMQNMSTEVTFQFSLTSIVGVRAEVIGKFTGDVNYQLRYIKEPAPIILENLDSDDYTDVTIKGQKNKSACELPEEMHEEILERAVTLAKIAWQGSTATQVAAAQQNNRNND